MATGPEGFSFVWTEKPDMALQIYFEYHATTTFVSNFPLTNVIGYAPSPSAFVWTGNEWALAYVDGDYCLRLVTFSLR